MFLMILGDNIKKILKHFIKFYTFDPLIMYLKVANLI